MFGSGATAPRTRFICDFQERLTGARTCELWRLPYVTVTPPTGACQGPCCPRLALAGTVRDIGLQQAMTLPDMW